MSELKVGIFGGTFDPVHIEHVSVAKSAICELGLDKLIIVPTFLPPHKTTAPTSYKHRLNMLSLAFKGVEKVEISSFEVDAKGKSYSYITAEHFKSLYNCQLYMLVGADMLQDFPTWKFPERILNSCALVAFNRKNYILDEKKQREFFKQKFGKEFLMLSLEGEGVSSTRIRTYAELGLDYSSDVGTAVKEYIDKNNLYTPDVYAEFIRSMLPNKRLIHTAEVIITAMQKCKELGLEEQEVRLSALLHDCAKYLDYKSVQGFSLPNGVPEPVIHSFLGAYVAQTVLGVKDEQVLDAIRYHTSGKANMTTLGKLIFVADMIEKGRSYEGVDVLRKLYEQGDFEKCFLECLKEEAIHLKNKKQDVYFETLNACKYYLNENIMEKN